MEIRLVKTCDCSPEQYDAYIGDMRVGYIRVRWGQITVTCPWVGGEVVYSSMTDGYGSLAEHERARHLSNARKAIELWNRRETLKHDALTNVIDALDLTQNAIYQLTVGCGMHDEALEKLADTLECFAREYEQKL